jgi:hypothetical protein
MRKWRGTFTCRLRSSGRFKQTKQQWRIKDENSRHEDANEHLKKDAKARLKKASQYSRLWGARKTG